MKFQKLAKDKSSLVRVFSISVLVTQRQRETSGSRIGEVTAGCVAAPVMPEAWEDVCVGERRLETQFTGLKRNSNAPGRGCT